MRKFQENMIAWLVPALLAFLGWVGQSIVDKLSDLNTTMAVAVQRVDDHDRRLGNLEALYFSTQH